MSIVVTEVVYLVRSTDYSEPLSEIWRSKIEDDLHSSRKLRECNDGRPILNTLSVNMKERGFVPPVARRKQARRMIQRRAESRRNYLFSTLVICFGGTFLAYNIWYFRRTRATSIELAAPDSQSHQILRDTKLRGGRAWISQNSQPFVSFNSVLPQLWMMIHS